MTIPDAKSATMNAIAKNEPWLHAKHVTQCFFITDPCNPSHVVVRRGKRNIIGMMESPTRKTTISTATQ